MNRNEYPSLKGRFNWLETVKGALASVPRDVPALIGVSGGVDSCVLLYLLRIFGFERLVVCHLNHNLRGSESERDLHFVGELCQKLEVPLHAETLESLPSTESLETAARTARFEFFARAASLFGTSTLFLAHHADDQIETFLFNLFRGTGAFGNAIIKAESIITIKEQELILLRPLLRVWKDQLRAFAAACRIQYREDQSNADRDMTRNRIRHGLIPEIERVVNRPVKATLLREIEVAEKEGEFIRSQVPVFHTAEELPVFETAKLPIAIQRRVIHAWLKYNKIQDFGFAEVEAVRSLISSRRVAKVNLPGNVFCRRRSGRLFLQFT